LFGFGTPISGFFFLVIQNLDCEKEATGKQKNRMPFPTIVFHSPWRMLSPEWAQGLGLIDPFAHQ